MRNHEAYLQALLDGSPVAIMITDLDSGTIRFANRQALEYTGLTAYDGEQVSARQFWVDPNERERLFEQLIQEGHASGEVTLKNGSGELFHAMLTCQYNPGTTNEVLWWVIGISEQKKIQQQLQQNERMLQQILDHLPVALWVKDINDGFRHTVYNKACEELFGRPAEDVLGKTEFDFQEPGEALRIRQEDIKIAQSGEILEFPQDCIESISGEIRYGHTIKLAVPDGEGKPSLILGLSQDMTEQRETGFELKNSEKRFRELAANAPVGIFLTDPNGACIYVNEYWQKMTGRDQEQAAGSGWTAALHADDFATITSAWQKLTTGGSGFAEEYRFVRPDGSVTWVTGTAVAFRNHADQVVGFLKSTTDITQRKLFEAELELSRDEAQRANVAKSEFLSRMSHELRTPLNAVLGFGQLLQMDNENFTLAQNAGISHILAGGEHLLHLIDDVLDYARIETGHMGLTLQRCSLEKVLERSVSLVRSLAEQAHITVIRPLEEMADIIADPWRTQQILVNLLSNAIKYNKAGGTVTLSSAVLADHMLRVSIQDSGRGIRPEDQERLFKPFERVTHSDSTVDGTGIGLSICRKLVELMGGQIGFSSNFGIGSTFWFELPAAHTTTPLETFSGDASLSILLRQLEGVRVLYVEDHLASIKLMAEITRHIPACEFMAAGNVADGVALAKSSRPDLILMDINLPEPGGFEALAILKNDERTREIPVIALSASASPELIARGNEAGFKLFLPKPLKLDSLLRAIATEYRHTA